MSERLSTSLVTVFTAAISFAISHHTLRRVLHLALSVAYMLEMCTTELRKGSKSYIFEMCELKNACYLPNLYPPDPTIAFTICLYKTGAKNLMTEHANRVQCLCLLLRHHSL